MNMLSPIPAPVSSGPAAQGEVRRCAKCAEAAVVLVFEWTHSSNRFRYPELD